MFPQQYKLFILSLAGDVVGSFKPDPDPGFGIRNVVWHPSDMFLAVSGWDNKVSTNIANMNKSSLVADLHIGAVNMD
jgi:hypothetical protein